MILTIILKILIVTLLSRTSAAVPESVRTSIGRIHGKTIYYDGIKIRTFLGIPYAEPPVGKLRFKRTVSLRPAFRDIQAKSYSPACVQYFPYDYPWTDQYSNKSEDCLYLNIWAPTDTSRVQKEKAVMFWIFSGGFSTGSNRKPEYDGQVLAAKGNVVVVTVNYRLNALGFLSSGNEAAPGNYGLFDVLEALKWVNNNIHIFGGDKDKITVFGQSAGSLISGYLCISPLSRGLFQRAILESAAPTSLKPDAIKKNLSLGQKLAEAVGCASSNITLERNSVQVVNCLRKKDAMHLVSTVNSFNPSSVRSFPVIHGDPFLPQEPKTAVKEGNFQDLSILIGNVKDEGSFRLVSFKPEVFGAYGELKPRINKTFGEHLIRSMFTNFTDPEAIVKHYLNDIYDYDYDTIRRQVYDSFGDFDEFCTNLYFAERYAKRGNDVYFYYFTHQTRSVWAKWMGVTHFTEVPFVFGRPFVDAASYSNEERKLSCDMLKMWSNFAKYGLPSFKWRTFTRRYPHIYVLGTDNTSDDNLQSHLDNCEFFRPYFGF